MTISREDVDAGRVDFSDLIDPEAEPIGPIHPGEILRHDWLEPFGIDASCLASDLGLPLAPIAALLDGEGDLTAEIALRLARYFGTDAQSWINLQNHYDLDVARERLRGRLEMEVRRRTA